jgi:hypothetical protein
LSEGLGPLLDSEEDPARLWAEIHRLREAVSGPNGYATWQDAAMAERMRRFDEKQKLTEWMVKNGMLHYHDHCRRPDGSHGPAWVIRAPYMVNGDSCEAWSAGSAADALREFLRA